MDEYRKSEYFKDRAETARETASMEKFKDAVYLHNRIKECNSNIKTFQKNIVQLENTLYKIGQGEEIKNYHGNIITAEKTEENINYWLEKMEAELDKLAYMENCLDACGVKFNKDNIRAGYIVNMKRWGKCEIISCGSVNVQYKILTGGAAGLGGSEPYEAITEILQVKEAPAIINPYTVGDILTKNYMASGKIYKAYQVVKTADKSAHIQEIEVVDDIPQKDKFKAGSKPMLRKITKSKFSDFVGVYEGDWLNKFSA
jgi:hypothetical protein